MIKEIKEKAQKWLEGNYNNETKERVKYLLENDEKELIESFYKDLEFGTGGLRGIMGVGTNRMNIYTIGMATQGLCNYIKTNFSNLKEPKVAIAYDCRNNSRLFAETSANIFAANGIKTYLFEELRPTPELSFAIRQLGCQSGVVITASHNPKEYNGFKAYWEDGGQITSPHDKNIVAEAQKISNVDEVKFETDKNSAEIITLGKDFDKTYLEEIKKLSLSTEIINENKDLGIVFTPIHGTGVELAPAALKLYGFENIYNVPKQDVTDGNFPTVISPNPENAEALEMAINKAKEVSADLVMATDPDADRVGIAVCNSEGEFVLLNGNQTASILIYYLLSQWKKQGKIQGKEYIVKTIVTSEILIDIANKFNVESFDVLTGFKYIAEVIKENEGKKTFIGGGEESYGYLAGEFVRDKDAIMSCTLIAEAAAWARSQNKNLLDLLTDIYKEFSFYKEELINVVKKGKEGAEEIKSMMENYRKNPPLQINNSKVVLIKDYQTSIEKNIETNQEEIINLPKSNVLQFFLEDGSKISVRPSGTEPKIKFYISVKTQLTDKKDFAEKDNFLTEKIEGIKTGL